MTTIYGQLRVSCGLSATVNSLQPETFKATMSQSLAKWLDIQWLKLTNNEDPSDPLVQLAGNTREFQWVCVLDYILLRKIQSSFILCDGLNPGGLVLELEFEDLNWTTLTPAFIKIFNRLNARKEDWPLWRYNGEFDPAEDSLKNDENKKEAVKLVQSIKVFWEIFSSNITVGPEGEWKNIFMNLVGFPQTLTNAHVAAHIDNYKTDFELSGLLQTLGFEIDSTYGRGYPKAVVSNSIILINRPEHWVCEDHRSRGMVLDSLTQATDSVHPGDSFNYYKPEKNLSVARKQLKKLESLFPDIEVYVDEEDLIEFPELELPETNNPIATAQKYHHSAEAAWKGGEYRDALLDKRIEVNLLAKSEKNAFYYTNVLQFTEWCISQDKIQTAQENFLELGELEGKIPDLDNATKAKRCKIEAKLHSILQQEKNAINSLMQAFNLYKDTEYHNEAFELAQSLGAAYSRSKDYKKAMDIFLNALEFAEKAKNTSNSENETGPKKYWPAIIKALNRKIDYCRDHLSVSDNPDAIQKVE